MGNTAYKLNVHLGDDPHVSVGMVEETSNAWFDIEQVSFFGNVDKLINVLLEALQGVCAERDAKMREALDVAVEKSAHTEDPDDDDESVCLDCGRDIRWDEDIQNYVHISTRPDGNKCALHMFPEDALGNFKVALGNGHKRSFPTSEARRLFLASHPEATLLPNL